MWGVKKREREIFGLFFPIQLLAFIHAAINPPNSFPLSVPTSTSSECDTHAHVYSKKPVPSHQPQPTLSHPLNPLHPLPRLPCELLSRPHPAANHLLDLTISLTTRIAPVPASTRPRRDQMRLPC